MKIKNIIIFYPSFEAGGVEKIIENLTFFFTKKGLKVYLISTKTKNLKILKNKYTLIYLIVGNSKILTGQTTVIYQMLDKKNYQILLQKNFKIIMKKNKSRIAKILSKMNIFSKNSSLKPNKKKKSKKDLKDFNYTMF